MSKKKPAGGSEKDRHKSPRVVRIPIPYHDLLKEVAKEDRRAITWELLLALDDFFRKKGRQPPPP